ncbi:unnamed protein product [Camellia sinensis]
MEATEERKMEVTEEGKMMTTATNTGAGGGSTKIQMDSITAWFVVGLFSATFVCSAVTQLIDTYTNSSANPLWFQLVRLFCLCTPYAHGR